MGAEGVCWGYETAWEKWREARRAVSGDNPPDLLVRLLFQEHPQVDATALPVPCHLQEAPRRVAASFGMLDVSGMAHLLVSERASRYRSDGVQVHLCTGGYPQGSFFQCADGTILPHPGLVVAQMSAGQSDICVLKMLAELCGYFVPEEGAPTGVLACPPLCGRESLAAFFDRVLAHRRTCGTRAPYGLARVRGLLDLVVERAASPGEARLAWLLSLPLELGGYGLPAPHLNALTWLNARGEVLAGSDAVVCDLTWPEGLAFDYQGKDAHKLRSRKVSDEEKRLRMANAGWECHQVFLEQLKSLRSMDGVAMTVVRRLKVRFDPFDPQYLTARLLLRRDLLAPW